ncbi:MAG: chemotaxis response regulator protein-glutamate methylesterase [Desulfobacteraceae bacterium]|nr:chemotaxis response regulator protein-glutamate methylesterase [Desulfobacteraceae bacterium]
MNSSKALRILVVDDTVVYRKIVKDVVSQLPGVEVVGTAHNGVAALHKIRTLKPDLLTLDIEMPEMNGIEVLEHLNREALDVGAIMLSTLTYEGGTMTMRALELGAFDFIPKPQSGANMAENTETIKKALAPVIKAFSLSRDIQKISGRKRKVTGKASPSKKKITPTQTIDSEKWSGKASIVAIGISTGGPNALAKVLPRLPATIGVPIVIVQHMPPIFTNSLAKSLNSKCALDVREATDGEPLKPNIVYIAPGGKQMKVIAGADGRQRVIRITDHPPENSCKPSADYLFRSIAEHFVGRATGVIMTGMGSDGTSGLQMMKNNGAFIIAQDEPSCVVFGMPKAPIELNIVNVVSPLDRIADTIIKTVFPADSQLTSAVRPSSKVMERRLS